MLQIDQALSNENAGEIKTILGKQLLHTGKLAIQIIINESEVLTRQITLPANTEENLYEVIQYEMDRYTPFTAEDIYFDYRLEERIPDKDLIRVLLIVIKKEIIEPIKHIIDGDKIVLDRIDVVNQDNSNVSIFNVRFLRSNFEQTTTTVVLSL